jgi:ribosomal protein S17E
MIWQDYRKLYANALKQYSPKFKKELQKQVDTFCRTQDYDAISSKGISKTIKQLHVALGTKMATTTNKSVKKATKGFYEPFEIKMSQSNIYAYVILQFLERQGVSEIADEITKTTINQIAGYLQKGFEQNLSIQELIPMLKQAGITNFRAELIARTETGRAANLGAMVGATATGLVTIKEWISAQDARTRRKPPSYADHYVMDGVKVEFDKPFKVPTSSKARGGTHDGTNELMMHPCDSGASAANTCNCRCTVAFEAQRENNGKLKTLDKYPPTGNIGYIWNLLNNSEEIEIGNLIAQALQ